MASSKLEKLKLLLGDEPVWIPIAESQAAVQDNGALFSPASSAPPTNASAAVTNNSTKSSSTITYGEDIEPMIYSSVDETVSAPKSKSASGKTRRNKTAKQGSFTNPVQTTSVDIAISDDGISRNGLERGQLASLEETFCPIQAVSKYPYKHVSKQLSETVAQKSFNAGKFWTRVWDM